MNAGPREAVTDALKHSPWPFFGTAGSAGTIRISDGIAYSNGVAQLSGAPSYLAAAEAWHEQLLDEAPAHLLEAWLVSVGAMGPQVSASLFLGGPARPSVGTRTL